MSNKLYTYNWVVTLSSGQEVSFVDTDQGKLEAMRYSNALGGLRITRKRKEMY